MTKSSFSSASSNIIVKPLHDVLQENPDAAAREKRVDDLFKLLTDSYPSFAAEEDINKWKERTKIGVEEPIIGSLLYQGDKLIAFSSADVFPDGNVLIGYSCVDNSVGENSPEYIAHLAESKKYLIHYVEQLQKNGTPIGVVLQEHQPTDAAKIKASLDAGMVNLSDPTLDSSHIARLNYRIINWTKDQPDKRVNLWMANIHANNGNSVGENIESLMKQYINMNSATPNNDPALAVVQDWRSNVLNSKVVLTSKQLYDHVYKHTRGTHIELDHNKGPF